jgi:hypothetical protein
VYLAKRPLSIRDDQHNVRAILHFDEDDTYNRLWVSVDCKLREITLSWRLDFDGRCIDQHKRFYMSNSRGTGLFWRQLWAASWTGIAVPLEPRSLAIRHDRRPRLSLAWGATQLTWHLYQSEHFDVEATADLLLTRTDVAK